MPIKRKNHGRNKKNAGHKDRVPCSNCCRLVPKDKAVKRYNVKNIVDQSSQRDIKLAFAFQDQSQIIPKLYYKMEYCIACAIHARIVRVRSREERKIRTPPQRFVREPRPAVAQPQQVKA